jgi:hypothetical protein
LVNSALINLRLDLTQAVANAPIDKPLLRA